LLVDLSLFLILNAAVPPNRVPAIVNGSGTDSVALLVKNRLGTDAVGLLIEKATSPIAQAANTDCLHSDASNLTYLAFVVAKANTSAGYAELSVLLKGVKPAARDEKVILSVE
jgi:hypothetical protein